MNLKQRFSLYFSLLFMGILAAVLLVVLTLFADFRREEFEDRLQEKAENTLQLLIEVKEIDSKLLKIIDRNSIHQLYNEKVLIFDDQFHLIYSSIDDAVLTWTQEELEEIHTHTKFFKHTEDYDILGLKSVHQGKTYYVLLSAEDKYGNRKLTYLSYLLLGAFLIGVILVFLLSYYTSKKGLEPLDTLNAQISTITEKNLHSPLSLPIKNDELGQLGKSFNQMLARLDVSYRYQKEFAGNASHELRTPIARIAAQLENITNAPLPEATKATLSTILDETYQLSDIVASLLVMAKVEGEQAPVHTKRLRLDEVIFDCANAVRKLYPAFRVHFDIAPESDSDADLCVLGDETLLKIAFHNLLRNAYLYSDDKQVHIVVTQHQAHVVVALTNTGSTPHVDNPQTLFQPFQRGSNSQQKSGNGLGLSIIQRILTYHDASIRYEMPDTHTNRFVVEF